MLKSELERPARDEEKYAIVTWVVHDDANSQGRHRLGECE